MRYSFIFLLSLMAPLSALYVGQDASRYVKDIEEPQTQSPIDLFLETTRVDILTQIDRFLEFAFQGRSKFYAQSTPPKVSNYSPKLPELQRISAENGFFSNHPLVATVSSGINDMRMGCGALKELYDQGAPDLVQIAGSELLTKVMAYRELKQGQMVSLPAISNGEIVVQRFQVDHIFNLWLGIPAFGLVPVRKNTPAILLFRGTDFSFYKLDGLASLLSDLDPSGPGMNLYNRSRTEIREWLQKMKNQGNAARVLGFSLGGSVAMYTYVNEYDLLSKQGSIVFNAPGVPEEILKQWNELPAAWKKGLTNYITQGDVIPKTGYLIGTVYELSTNQDLTPLRAHTLFVSGQTEFQKSAVDVDQENEQRK